MLEYPSTYIQRSPQPAPPPAPPPVVTPPTASVDPVSTGFDLKQITDQLYGKPIPVSLGGRRRMGGYICWGPRLRYAQNGQRLWSFAVSFGFAADPDGVRNVLEIRFDSTVVYSALTNVVTPWLKWRFYPGTETQQPDPLATLMQGTAATAFRGQMVIFFEDVPSQTIPFVGALIADRVSGGLTAHFFDTPTSSAIRTIGAIDWAAGIMYTSGGGTTYTLIAHRLSDRSQIFDVPIINLARPYTELNEIAFLWCPEGQVIFGLADTGDGLHSYLVAVDPDSAAIVAEAPNWGGNVFGGFTYYADTTTGGVVVVVASVDTLINNSLHIDFYARASGFGFNYVSPSNLDGHGSGGNITTVIRVPDGGTRARFLIAQGAVLVLADVDVVNQEVALSTCYTASAVINNLYGDPIDRGVVLFLDDGTAIKLDSSYAEMWTATPGFIADGPGAVGNVLSCTDGWRKSLQTFAYYGTGGIYYMSLIDGSTFFEPDVSTSSHGGHMMWDAATNVLYITDNGDPEAFINGGTSDDTIPIASALTKLAQFWGYTANEFEVVDVPGDWIAVIVAYDTTFQDLLKVLQSIYPWDIIQTDKLRVIQRDLGTTLVPVGTITANDIKGADSGAASFLTTIAEDVEQPAINELQFIDPERDYNWNVARYRQPREPVAVTSSVSTQQIKIPIVMNMDDAKMLVAAKSYRDRVARATHAFTGMPSTYKYEPGDILTVDTGLRTLDAAKVTSTDAGSDWSIQFQLESLLATGPLYDASFWLTGVLPTDSGTPPTSTDVATDGSEFVIYLDTPILSQQPGFQDTGGTGLRANFTIGTRSESFSLRYAAFFFQSLYFWSGYFYFPIVAVPLYGTLTANLGNTATPFMTDYVNVLKFKRVCGDASVLQAITYEELMNSAQMFAVGRPGRWEILGAGLTMTTDSDGTITLTGLTRGRRGSEVFCGSHEVGDQVVCLGARGSLAPAGYANAVTAAIGSAILPTPAGTVSPYIGQQQLYASAIQASFGMYFGTAFGGGGYTLGAVLSSPITGNAERPYAPVHLDAVIIGSDIEIDWDRRDRLDFSHGGGADMPMSETAELYDVVILDGTTVKRTYANLSAPPFTYPAADITADWGSMPATLNFNVYQKSALTGRGFAGSATKTL